MHMNIRILSESKMTSHGEIARLSHPGLSHIEQECQESLIQEKIHNQQHSNEGLKYSSSTTFEIYAIQNYLVDICF